MKPFKLLSLPVALLITALMAVPAYANHALVTALTASCDQTGRICAHIEFTPSDIPTGGSRTLVLRLLGHKKGAPAGFTDTGVSVTITIPGSENGQLQKLDKCFELADATDFDEFKVTVTAGPDIDLQDQSVTATDGFRCAASPQSPSSPGPNSPPPSSSATANTTTTLANTGGFDFRFPVIGLVLVAAGGALYLVSVSRGRSRGIK